MKLKTIKLNTLLLFTALSLTIASNAQDATNPKTLKMEQATDEKIEVLKNIFSSNEHIKNSSDEEIEEALFKVQQKIFTLKNFYSDSKRIPEFVTVYEKYKKMADAETAIREGGGDASWKLQNLSTQLNMVGEKLTLKKLFEYVFTYADFQKDKEIYKSVGITDDKTEKAITNINHFYDVLIPEKSANFKKEIKEMCYEAFDENHWKLKPVSALKQLDKVLARFEDRATYNEMKNGGIVDELKKIVLDRKKFLDHYYDSGEYSAYFNKHTQKQIDARTLRHSSYRNASEEAIARNNFPSNEYGSIKKIVLHGWYVEKNALGIPLSKKMVVQVVAKGKKGFCHVYETKMIRDYEGGGKYGTKYIKMYYGLYEINCANINK